MSVLAFRGNLIGRPMLAILKPQQIAASAHFHRNLIIIDNTCESRPSNVASSHIFSRSLSQTSRAIKMATEVQGKPKVTLYW